MQLHLHNLTKSFDGIPVLRGLDLRVETAGALVLVGPSGGGKSTLLRIIAGLEYPDGGGVRMDGGELVFREESLRVHRRQVGVVFQSMNLFPHLTALENITLPLVRVHGHTPAQAARATVRRPAPARRHRARRGHPPAPAAVRRTDQRA